MGGVFICHASEDAATARRVVTLLEDAGITCWIAPRDIGAGENYTQAILDGLAAATGLVLVFSQAANTSPHVRRELETAVGSDTALFPVRLEPVEPSPALRYFIGTFQWLDAAALPAEEWEPLLVRGVRRLLVEPAAPPSTPAFTREPPTAPAGLPVLPSFTGTTWGRDALVADLVGLLGTERLVTLTGLGGIGKTRVAAEVSRLLPAVAVADDANPDRVARLLDATPAAPVLATSRMPLGLGAERVVPVPPLDGQSSTRLFHEAAQRSAPSFRYDEHVERVPELCRRLGGIPLGLELAAARLRVVGLDRLESSLDTTLDLLPGLEESVAGTLKVLDEPSRTLAERLAVFEGPVPLEAVEAVGGPGTVHALSGLVEAGLVQVDDTGPDVRYDLLHPVRLVARRRLESGDQLPAARAAAAAYLLDRVKDWSVRLDTADGPDVLAEFAAAAPDVVAAVDAALLDGRTPVAVDILLAGGGLWIASGLLTEAMARCRRVLDGMPEGDDRAARVHATLGRLAYHLTEWPTADAELRTALRLGDAHGDAVATAVARTYLSGTLLMSGHPDEGGELAERAYADGEALDLYPQAAEALSVMAIAHAISGELAEERAAHERRLAVVRRHGDIARTADALNTLAEIALDEDDAPKAHRYAAEALALAADRLPLERRDATITSARAAVALGRTEEATGLLRAALSVSGEIGQSLATGQCLRVGALLADAGGDPALAVRLFAAAQAVSPSPTGTDDPAERDFGAALERARTSLDDRAAEHEWTLGGALPLATILAELDAFFA